MDDGKVNVLSLQMLMEVNAALDRAAADRQVVVLTGREGIFSAGFDLAVLRAGTDEAIEMLRAGFELAERLLAFPTPVVVAVPGPRDRDGPVPRARRATSGSARAARSG